MKDFEIIKELKRLNVSLTVENGQLRLVGATENISNILLCKLKEQKAEIISFLKDASSQLKLDHIEKIQQQAHYLCSNAQKRIWLLSQLPKGSSAYNIVAGFLLQGVVRIDCLEFAVNAIIDRHESLRTTFKIFEGELRQEIKEKFSLKIPCLDIILAVDKENKIKRQMHIFKYWEFDLQNGPLIKLKLLRLSEKEYFLAFAIHHIVSDGWSISIFIKEVLECYNAACESKIFHLRPLDRQYKDYSYWLHERLNGSRGNKALEFWKDKVKIDIPTFDRIYDYRRPSIKTFDGAAYKFYIGDTYLRAVDYCKKYHLTPFNFFRAVITILLHKLSGQNEICIGTVVAGRNHIDLENQIGLYANSLPLRFVIDHNELIDEFFARVSEDSFDVFEFQDYPIDVLVEKLELQYDKSRNPLFDVMFILQNAGIGEASVDVHNQYQFKLNSIQKYLKETKRICKESRPSKFDLCFILDQGFDDEFFIEIEYSTKLLNDKKVLSIFKAFSLLVDQIISKTAISIADLKIVDSATIKLIEEKLRLPVPSKQKTLRTTFIDLFQQRVSISPELIALSFGKSNFTYKELESESNRFSIYLQKNYAIKPNDFVAICLDRSPWLIISILGILKSGAAYLPIDPSNPYERTNYMVSESKSKILIDQNKIDEFVLNSSKHHNDSFSFPKEGDLAYLIYTSGSTGRPKGAMVKRESFTNLVRWYRDILNLSKKDVVLLLAPISFDLAQKNIFTALISGARLHIPQDFNGNYSNLIEEIKNNNITVVNCAPSAFYPILEKNADFSSISSLKKIVLGGEPISTSRLRNWVTNPLFKGVIINSYGPTECTDVVTYYQLRKVDFETRKNIPIGKSIPNCEVLVLSDSLDILPQGIVGEICIGGVPVGSGYLNNKSLTEERFVNFPSNEANLIYKTGDLGRVLSDGNIEFIGRKDNQVKIRGVRIELAEIETVIQEYEGVTSAIVVVNESEDKEHYMTAFVTTVNKIDGESLLEYLSSILPSYMIPAAFVKLEAIPLTANGKIDRQQINSLKGEKISIKESAPAVSKTEKILLEIWKEILGLSKIEITENFFYIGGHSLKAARLNSTILDRIGKELSITEIFQFPTIFEQSRLLDVKPKILVEKIVKVKMRKSYPISFSQEKLRPLAIFEAASIAYNIPVALRVIGSIDLKILRKALRYIVNKFEILRTIFDMEQQGAVQIVKNIREINFDIDVIRCNENLDPELEAKTLRENWMMPFDLFSGPLFRCFILRSHQSDILSLNMHHIISDGLSLRIFLKELISCYEHLKRGEAVKIDKNRIQFKDWSFWQLNHLNENRLNKSKDFWLDKLKQGVPHLNFPTDFPRPKLKDYLGATYKYQFQSKHLNLISTLSKKRGVSNFTFILALVNILLRKYTGEDELIIGTPISIRDHPQVYEQIGLFIETLPILTTVHGDLTFESLLNLQKEAILDSIEHKECKFDAILAELGVMQEPSKSPLFDVLVVFQEEDQPLNLSSSDFHLEVLPILSETSKYDLTFSFYLNIDNLILDLEYRVDLFKQSTIIRIVDDFVQILEAVTDNPNILIKDLNILNENEANRIAYLLNSVSDSCDSSLCLVDLVSNVSYNLPNATALLFGEKKISYQELNQKSGQLARILVEEFKVKVEDKVVLLFDKSEYMIIAMVAVLKAGACYVPVDPIYPNSRIEYILSDTGSKLVLFESILPLDKGDFSSIQFLEISSLNYSGKPLSFSIDPKSLAYIMYTSGTTGDPKGVLVEHRNVVSILENSKELFDFNVGDRWSFFHSFCFDVSVWEIFGALSTGGTLVIVPKEIMIDPFSFYKFLHSEKIAILNQTPTSFKNLESVISSGSFDKFCFDVRYLVFAGEPLYPKILELWYSAIPQCKIVNMYGITETTIYTTFHEVKRYDIEMNVNNIGLPMSSAKCFILDKDLKQVAFGIPGELYIGGAGLSRGYLNKPELTCEKFVNSPFNPKEKLYKTGDFVRILSSGELQYLGRKDDQIKIRGYRIEVSEIEKAMCSIEGISYAVVLVDGASSVEAEIIAYFVSIHEFDKLTLFNAISKILPHYMIPAYFIRLKNIPLNNSGKIDKKLLPNIIEEKSKIINSIPCRNVFDERILNIWKNVLGRSDVSIRDNFFALGGHSLKATSVISKIQEDYGIKIDMRSFYMYPTVEELSNYVETVKWMDSNETNEGTDIIL